MSNEQVASMLTNIIVTVLLISHLLIYYCVGSFIDTCIPTKYTANHLAIRYIISVRVAVGPVDDRVPNRDIEAIGNSKKYCLSVKARY